MLRALSVLLCVLCFLNYCSFQVVTSQRAERHEGDVYQVTDVRNLRASIFSPITLLKMPRTSNTRFGSSANALG